MKKTIIERIENYNIGDDCIQTSVSYRNAMTIVGQDGVLYHYMEGSDKYINKYLEDERRKQFPYSNIPTYYRKDGMFKIKTCVNQLFDFEKPYIEIHNGSIIENYAVKDRGIALLIRKEMTKYTSTKHMTYDELMEFVGSKQNPNEQTYYINIDGSMYANDKEIIPSEERIYNHIKEQFQKNIRDFREYELKYSDEVSLYLKSNPWFLNYIEQSIINLDYSLIDFNFGIGDESPIYIVRVNGECITIQGVLVTFVKKGDYKVEIYDVPINKYTLEQLKFASKISVSKEPKIPLKINPGVTAQDIQESRRMIRELKN